MQRRYLRTKRVKFNKVVTVIIATYLIISFIPYYPEKLMNMEVVTAHNYEKVASGSRRSGARMVNIIRIYTDAQKNYQFDGRVLGPRHFSEGDTIISCQDMLFKTTGVIHQKYGVYYPVDRSFGLRFLLVILMIVQIGYGFFNNYKYAILYNYVVIATISIFVLYLFFA